MERANLRFDAKGKATSGSNREGESTEAERRGGAARRSDEGLADNNSAAAASNEGGSRDYLHRPGGSVRFVSANESQRELEH